MSAWFIYRLLTNSLGVFLIIRLHIIPVTTGDCIALKIPLFLIAATLSSSFSVSSIAEEKLSAVQAAAAARLVGKLGKLRGSLKLGDRSVFLTPEMIRDRVRMQNRVNYIGEILKKPDQFDKPKLPPIVWDIGPEMDRVIERVMTGSIKGRRERQQIDIKPNNLQLDLTLASVGNTDSFRPTTKTTRRPDASHLRRVSQKWMPVLGTKTRENKRIKYGSESD